MRPEFMIERQGKMAVLYAGLLDEAHQQGLQSITTEIVQIPTAENGNMAICRATCVTEKGTFTGHGDASPSNVAKAMATCLLRMSETRAKARALRDAINIGTVSLEELPGGEGHSVRTERQGGAPAQQRYEHRPAQQQQAAANGDAATAAQRAMIENLCKQQGKTPPTGYNRDEANVIINDLRSHGAAAPANDLRSDTRPAAPPSQQQRAPTHTSAPRASSDFATVGSAAVQVIDHLGDPPRLREAKPIRSELPDVPPIGEGQRRTIAAMAKELCIEIDTSHMSLTQAQAKITELRARLHGSSAELAEIEAKAKARALQCLEIIGFTPQEVEQVIKHGLTGRTPEERITQWNVVFDWADDGRITPGDLSGLQGDE